VYPTVSSAVLDNPDFQDSLGRIATTTSAMSVPGAYVREISSIDPGNRFALLFEKPLEYKNLLL
jgi:hypothetical protein